MNWRIWPIWMSSEMAQRIEDKVDELRRDVAQLKEQLDKLMKELGG